MRVINLNINCTNKCNFQKEGKCTLSNIPLCEKISTLNYHSDCPYNGLDFQDNFDLYK